MTDATNDIVKADIVDERTGEIIPKGASSAIATVNYTIDFSKIGTIELDERAAAVLDEPLDPEEVQIRPDGLVYLPWTFYAKRLNRAFGRLSWGLVPNGLPMSKDVGYDNVLVAWGFWLVVRGTPISYAIGETTYQATNQTMSYGDACEGAKSSSLARNCKVLGIALELWDARWVEEWRRKHAETYVDKKGKTRWRKKVGQEQGEAPNPQTEPMAAQAKELADGFTGKQILANAGYVQEIARLTGKTVQEVCRFVSGLPKDEKLTLQQVANKMAEG